MPDSVLKTLCYFDIFNTPLTKEEIFRWSWEEENLDYLTFLKKLDFLTEKNIIKNNDGYYFLPATSKPGEVGPGQENNIYLRQKSVSIIEKKMQIAVKGIKKLRWIPFIEAVFVCNTVASAGVKKESDIDVFIVIKKGRLWISRFLSTLTLEFFRLRRNKKNITDKICLSFYTTDDALDLSKIKIEGTDIYLIFWLDNLIPIYDPKNIQAKIKQANFWIKNYLPNAKIPYEILGRWKIKDGGLSKYIKLFFEKAWSGKYGDMVEAQAKGIQKTKMKMNLMSTQNKNGAGVIISDSMLKFHENDRREEYKNKWLTKLSNFKT